jgi:hypothetical protein
MKESLSISEMNNILTYGFCMKEVILGCSNPIDITGVFGDMPIKPKTKPVPIEMLIGCPLKDILKSINGG